MELLRTLMQLQEQRGCLDDSTLREFSETRRVSLYRLEELVSFYPYFRRTPPPKAAVHVCRDVVCSLGGCRTLTSDLRKQLEARDDIELTEVSCLGRCEQAPALAINDVPVEGGATVSDLLESIDKPDRIGEHPPRNTPKRWICNPYASSEAAYGTVLDLIASGADVDQTCIDRLSECGLRGMGGAGFPTGTKWDLVAREPGETKYVICNADESEPGTFKDRVILDELPELVVEGMLLAGLTVGAERGIVYLRHEYAREGRALAAALERARTRGILGENAAGSGRRFEVEIFISPGGYILGEETALLEALEDKRGEPRNKPPYPGTHGLWGRPTLINNVETFALATSIIHHGQSWWEAQGAGEYSGLKFVSVSGDVEHPGVYEIPIGTKVAQLLEIAGGMKDGKALQAFLPGGASSRFLTSAHLETPFEFEALKQAGSMLGTGAVIVFSEGRDLFSAAINLVRFFRNESCGKCVPCRIGSEKAVEVLEQVQAGNVATSELEILPLLGETLEQTSICGLGQVALLPMLSLLDQFPELGQLPGGQYDGGQYHGEVPQ